MTEMFNMCGLLNKICVNCILQLGGFRKEMQFVKEIFHDIMSMGNVGNFYSLPPFGRLPVQ